MKLKKRKELNLKNVYPIFILITTLFFCIGYAQIGGITLTINATAEVEPPNDVFITNVQYKSNVDADTINSKVNYYLNTMIDTTVVLGNNSNSSITYEITMYNNTDKEYVFIKSIVNKEEESLYSNPNITFSLNIEEGKTTIAPKEELTFEITYTYVGTDISNNTLDNKINFRFREKPIINLSNEGETYILEKIYPGYTPEEYEFTVTNYSKDETKINGVPLTYKIETEIEGETEENPITAKIYDENGNEITETITLEDDGITKTSEKYILKIIWEEDKLDEQYANKEYTCKVKLTATPEDEEYEAYKEEKEFEIGITTASFYFNAEVESNNITMRNDQASITLNIKNYETSTKYNTYNTEYEISLEDTSKFTISLTDSNNGTLTSGAKDNEVLVTITPKEGATINDEEQINLIVKAVSPFEYEENIAINITYVKSITNANIGDYIDLGNNIVGTEATTDDWRILYVDEDGTVYAILADYLPNSTGYATNAGLDTSGTYGVYSSTSRDTLLTGLTTTSYWSGLANGIEGATVTGTPTGDLLMNSYNTKNGTSLIYTDYPTLSSSTEDYDLYVPHTSEYESCYGYWLASPNDHDSYCVFRVDYFGIVTGSSNDLSSRGTRPVVTLPSNTTISLNGDIWTVERTPTNANIGDYIDLGNNIVGTSATTDDWRILYVDEDGTVYAILADYLPNSTGYATNAGLDTYGTYGVYSSTSRDTLLTGLITTSNWSGLANGIEGATVTGSPTADLLMNSYNTKNGTSLSLESKLSSSTEDYDLYVPHTSDYESCSGYWLAKLGDDLDYLWRVDAYGSKYAFDIQIARYGIRPVLSLPYDVSVSLSGGIWTVDE